MAFTALTASADDRKVVVFWTPGKNLLSNSAIPCIHADPYFGDLKPGESRSARGVLIFTLNSLEKLVEELAETVYRIGWVAVDIGNGVVEYMPGTKNINTRIDKVNITHRTRYALAPTFRAKSFIASSS